MEYWSHLFTTLVFDNVMEVARPRRYPRDDRVASRVPSDVIDAEAHLKTGALNDGMLLSQAIVETETPAA